MSATYRQLRELQARQGLTDEAWFEMAILPYLQTAFLCWVECMIRHFPQLDLKTDWPLTSPAPSIWQLATWIANPPSATDVKLEFFSAAHWDETMVEATLQLWLEQILVTANWLHPETGAVFLRLVSAVDLHQSLLPSRISIGHWAFQLQVGKYYLPSQAAEVETRAFYDATAKEFQTVADWELKKQVIRSLVALLPAVEGKIIDGACGNGIAHQVFPDLDFIGVDFSQRMVMKALKQGETVAQANLRHEPFAADLFAHGLLSFVEHHLIATEQTLRELHRVIKPGGYLVLNVYRADEGEGWRKHWSELLSNCGFIEIEFSEEDIPRQQGGQFHAHYIKSRVG